MRHIIFGGDGIVGRHLVPLLLDDGPDVVVADIHKGDYRHYAKAAFRRLRRDRSAAVGGPSASGPTTWVFNCRAKMLSPIQVRAKRHDFFFPVKFSTARKTSSSPWTGPVHPI